MLLLWASLLQANSTWDPPQVRGAPGWPQPTFRATEPTGDIAAWVPTSSPLPWAASSLPRAALCWWGELEARGWEWSLGTWQSSRCSWSSLAVDGCDQFSVFVTHPAWKFVSARAATPSRAAFVNSMRGCPQRWGRMGLVLRQPVLSPTPLGC